MRERKSVQCAVIVLFALFWMFIAAAVPYTHDDWDWGLDAGLEQWLTCSVNSRLVGNFFVIIMTRSAVVKTLLMGGCMILVPLLLSALMDRSLPFLARFICANGAVLLLPLTVWRQTFGWVSGFANYVTSFAMLIGWILLARRMEQGGRISAAFAPLMLLYALTACLILENLALLILLLCICTAAKCFLLRKNRILTIAAVLGAAVGCFLIFQNPIYHSLAVSGEALSGIRSLSFDVNAPLSDMLAAVITRFVTVILPQPFLLSPIFCVSAGILPFLCLYRGGRMRWYPAAILSAVCGILLCFSARLPTWCVSVCAVILWIAAIPAAMLSGDGAYRRTGLLVIAVGSIAPLAITTENGERLYLVVFLLVTLTVLDAAAPILHGKYALILCTVLVSVQLAGYVRVYCDVLESSALRKELTSTAIADGADTLILPTERIKIWWGRNPQADWRAEYYREFYGLPDDMTLIFLPAGSLGCWPEIRAEDWENRMEYPPFD